MSWNSPNPDYVSDFHNCIFYNAILRNNNPYDDEELDDLNFMFEEMFDLPGNIISEYYFRSERLIDKLNELGINSDQTWIEIYNNNLAKIMLSGKNDDYYHLPEMLRKEFISLESKYGVE
jgi:hypothetical protein